MLSLVERYDLLLYVGVTMVMSLLLQAGPKVVTLMNVMGRELLKQRLSQIINE